MKVFHIHVSSIDDLMTLTRLIVETAPGCWKDITVNNGILTVDFEPETGDGRLLSVSGLSYSD